MIYRTAAKGPIRPPAKRRSNGTDPIDGKNSLSTSGIGCVVKYKSISPAYISRLPASPAYPVSLRFLFILFSLCEIPSLSYNLAPERGFRKSKRLCGYEVVKMHRLNVLHNRQ